MNTPLTPFKLLRIKSLHSKRLLATTLAMTLSVGMTVPASATWEAATKANVDQVNVDSNKKSLVNEQLVLADLGPSGLPEKSELINRIVATGFDSKTIAVDTSTNRLRFLDQPGAPELDGQQVLYPIGGQPQTTVTSVADFEKPLPIALHAEYATPQGGQRGVNPGDIPGKSGDLDVTYTVTNTTVKREPVSYQTADGTTKTEELPVFAPFVGVLQATLPANIKVTKPGDAVVGTSKTGETTLTWNLALYPPIGNYEQRLNFSVNSSALTIPGVTMEVIPISNDQSPATAFTAKLLSESVKGNQSMIESLDKVNSAILQMASGSSKLTSGLDKAQHGSATLTDGAEALTAGLDELAANLDKLAGPGGLPASADAAGKIADSVQQIAARIGGPWDKPLPYPLPEVLPKNVTMYQIVDAFARASGILTMTAASLTATLARGTLAADYMSDQAKDAREDAKDAVDILDGLLGELCGPTSAILPDQCDSLEDARDEAESARNHANNAYQRGDDLDNELALATVEAGAITAAVYGLTRAMPIALRQITGLSLALDSRDTGSPAVRQSLLALQAALLKASHAVDLLSGGADAAATGSGALASGSSQMDQALLALASGSSEMSNGAGKLSSEGTERMMSEIIKASKTPGLADAYLKAASNRANESAPYPTPEGGVSHVAYVYSMNPVSDEQSSPAVLLGILGLIAVGGGILIFRRIRTAPTK